MKNSTFFSLRVQAQSGFSITEMMISIVLGLLILAAMASLFVNQSRVRSELDKSNRMIDNGRYAMEVLSTTLRLAGYYDTYVPTGTVTTISDPCNVSDLTNAAKNAEVLNQHVQGYNVAVANPVTSGKIASLPATCGFTYESGSVKSVRSGSDILVVRRAATSNPVVTPNGKGVYLQASKCPSDSVKFQIGLTASSTIHAKDCATAATLRPLLVEIYFIGQDNNLGDGVPTLKKMELDLATGAFVVVPLVEGIEYMRIDYGVDNAPAAALDGAPDEFKVMPTAEEWPSVTAVRVSLLARNTETSKAYTDKKTYNLGLAGEYPAANDAYKRHAFTQVIRLVNPSARRELP